ncbi:PTS fructose-like transporter subunit IIBC [Rahnella perminowiae]|uniref:PTS fructose-like transporter subunit IIBC n=1 Tax=Rahnella perminowiae TaxID=2816244 RepID=UPI00224AF993|nr:PTS fructose-like transporter subunit IIBC [Rahnella perminowiae]MCX2941837.1 PTS fructose-like transporter subunit IIBC [Rahnella perminowiae]
MENNWRLVAVTNCPAGIAHTYMVAEALERKARSLGHDIKVETQGASGVENTLTAQEIEAADFVILALGRTLSEDDRRRFAGKRVLEMKISDALKNIPLVFNTLEEKAMLMKEASGVRLGQQPVKADSIMNHLMAGVSAALPFVIGGGLLVALANMLVQMGLPYIAQGNDVSPSFTWIVESIGYLGFKFMIPVMGAYIASSVGDKPAFAPAFLVSYLANDSAMLGTSSGAGFLGAVVLGLSIGYFVRVLRKVRLGNSLQPLLGSMLIPFVTLALFGLLTYYLIGPVMAGMMELLLHLLNTISMSMKLGAACLVGAMLAFDMGGPVNKTAWFFCFSLLDKGIYDWYAIVGVVALMPPMSAALATFLAPRLFTEQERGAAVSTLVVGATVATEPAIPYALAAPLPMITANTLSGGIAGMLVMVFGLRRLAPGLGVFDPLIGLMSPWYSFYLVLGIGLLLNVAFIVIFKNWWMKRQTLRTATDAI